MLCAVDVVAAVGLALARQLSKEQGIPLLGSAKIVPEFFLFYIRVTFIHLKFLLKCRNMDSPFL